MNLSLNLFGWFSSSEQDNSENSNFEQLCRKINERFKNGNIKSLLLLLDDADSLLAAEWGTSALQVLLDLRQKTNGAFKFVLATEHNPVNSPVLNSMSHDQPELLQALGTPVCLKPLSRADAWCSLARPLSMAGFDLSSAGDCLDTIVAHANYYPGQLNFIGRQIISDLESNCAHYYGNNGNLPFALGSSRSDNGCSEKLDAVLGSAAVNQHIRDAFLASLGTGDSGDRRYFMLACAITWVYHESGGFWDGVSVAEILNAARGNDLHLLANETENSCRALLEEMCDMGVLIRVYNSDDEPCRYRLARRRFVDFIGRTPDVLIDVMLAGDIIAQHTAQSKRGDR